MSSRLIMRAFSVAIFPALMMFSSLNALAGDTKGMNDSGASQTLEAKVKEALREHKHVKTEVTGGDVVLRGHVETLNEKKMLESQVRGVPGVKYVRDEVKVEQGKLDAAEDYVEDSALTTKVKAKILATKGLDSLDIHVKTEQGVVTLSGKVKNADEIGLAEKVACETKGVKKVVNNLSVQR